MNCLRINAFHENVILEIENIDTSQDSVIVEDHNTSKPIIGKIIDKGCAVPDYVIEGELVVFRRYSGVAIPKRLTNGKEQILINYRDLIGGIVDEN